MKSGAVSKALRAIFPSLLIVMIAVVGWSAVFPKPGAESQSLIYIGGALGAAALFRSIVGGDFRRIQDRKMTWSLLDPANGQVDIIGSVLTYAGLACILIGEFR